MTCSLVERSSSTGADWAAPCLATLRMLVLMGATELMKAVFPDARPSTR